MDLFGLGNRPERHTGLNRREQALLHYILSAGAAHRAGMNTPSSAPLRRRLRTETNYTSGLWEETRYQRHARPSRNAKLLYAYNN